MLDRTDDISASVENWLSEFERALAHPDPSALRPLFHPDSFWRDALALSWNLQTLNGADDIVKHLAQTPHPSRMSFAHSIHPLPQGERARNGELHGYHSRLG